MKRILLSVYSMAFRSNKIKVDEERPAKQRGGRRRQMTEKTPPHLHNCVLGTTILESPLYCLLNLQAEMHKTL